MAAILDGVVHIWYVIQFYHTKLDTNLHISIPSLYTMTNNEGLVKNSISNPDLPRILV